MLVRDEGLTAIARGTAIVDAGVLRIVVAGIAAPGDGGVGDAIVLGERTGHKAVGADGTEILAHAVGIELSIERLGTLRATRLELCSVTEPGIGHLSLGAEGIFSLGHSTFQRGLDVQSCLGGQGDGDALRPGGG